MPGSDPPAAVIFGVKGLVLEEDEKRFFSESRPLGFILFARNVDAPGQVRDLCRHLRECLGRPAPILIDQEGGRVQRLKPPHWRARPAAAIFGRLAARDKALAEKAVRLNYRLIAADLSALGIDVDCAPLLDVPVPGAHDVIGDRAFAENPETVAFLARAALEGLADGAVKGVVKHIPGHGRAMSDSHHELPVVEADLQTLREQDFAPFRALSDAPWAMTAHVVYKAIDPDWPATLSEKTISRVIRGEIGCRSLLLSDDLSMKALSGDFEDRARRTLAAGCDLALHCNGDMNEMRAVMKGVGPMTDQACERFELSLKVKRDILAPDKAEQTLEAWLKEAEQSA
ncbi:beta-hexosaminidase [Alphaproteobacteria bacterium]|nr:beta-hexosaminidase [Alphaproteobacteria bacterium]